MSGRKSLPNEPRLTIEQRREIFLALVEAQDRSVPVSESRAEVARQFNLNLDRLKAIEEEGVDNNWPPL
jgi:hypothetical protein